MLRSICVLAILSNFVIAAQAQGTRNAEDFRRFEIGWNVISYARQSGANLYGGDLSFVVRTSNRIGFVADLAVHDSILSLDTVTYRFGPRLYGPSKGRLTPFAEVLAGGTRATESFGFSFVGGNSTTSSSTNGFSLAAGGGADLRIKRWFAWRVAQADYSLVRINGDTSNGVRIGTGIVFRFGS